MLFFLDVAVCPVCLEAADGEGGGDGPFFVVYAPAGPVFGFFTAVPVDDPEVPSLRVLPAPFFSARPVSFAFFSRSALEMTRIALTSDVYIPDETMSPRMFGTMSAVLKV